MVKKYEEVYKTLFGDAPYVDRPLVKCMGGIVDLTREGNVYTVGVHWEWGDQYIDCCNPGWVPGNSITIREPRLRHKSHNGRWERPYDYETILKNAIGAMTMLVSGTYFYIGQASRAQPEVLFERKGEKRLGELNTSRRTTKHDEP